MSGKPQQRSTGGGQAHTAKSGLVLMRRSWVVERHFAWAARFRRLARDYERLLANLAAFHYFAFACS